MHNKIHNLIELSEIINHPKGNAVIFRNKNWPSHLAVLHSSKFQAKRGYPYLHIEIWDEGNIYDIIDLTKIRKIYADLEDFLNDKVETVGTLKIAAEAFYNNKIISQRFGKTIEAAKNIDGKGVIKFTTEPFEMIYTTCALKEPEWIIFDDIVGFIQNYKTNKAPKKKEKKHA